MERDSGWGYVMVLAPTVEGTETSLMERHEARPGVQVRVGEGYGKAELRGAVGTVQQIWGGLNYHTALLVRLEQDERYELFWHHEPHIVKEETIGA